MSTGRPPARDRTAAAVIAAALRPAATSGARDAGGSVSRGRNSVWKRRASASVAGSAIGTDVAQLGSAAALVTVVVRAARRSGAPLRPDPTGILRAAHAGLALVVRTLTLRASLLVMTYGAAVLGATSVATHQLASTLWSFLAFALDAIAIAALYCTLARRLTLDPEINADLTAVDRALAVENKWRAQRFGVQGSFVTRSGAVPIGELVDDLLALVAMDAIDLDCVDEVEHCRAIVRDGTAADGQIAVYREASRAPVVGAPLTQVSRWIAGTTPCALAKAAKRCSGGMCADDHRPRSPLVMRPWSVTAVASMNTSPAPPSTKRPQCAKWKSCAMPSTAE